MISQRQIGELLEKLLADTDLFAVGIIVKPGNRITVFLDSDSHVTLEACRRINHKLEEHLDRDKEDFDLTVSSAGVNQPLKVPRQFRKNTGRQLEIVTTSGEKFTGTVLSASDSGIEIEPVSSARSRAKSDLRKILNYNDIKTAKEVITFKK